MPIRSSFVCIVTASTLIQASLLAPSAFAQKAKDVEGAWTLVSIDDVQGSTRKPQYGPNPAGLLIFLPNGMYSLQIQDPTLPKKFAGGSREKGTPEENKAVVLANNPHWGEWKLNEADHTITFKIEHAGYPNWAGTTQVRKFTLSGDELKYTVPNPPNAGTNPEVVWKRLK